MTQPSEGSAGDHSDLWLQTLTRGHASQRFAHKLMRVLPGPPRCKVCYNPFGGLGGRMCRIVGLVPSKKNPRVCALCCEQMPRGGAEVEAAFLFADIRGSTALAEELGPAAFADTLNRFYSAATEVLIRYEATVDKLIGDEVMAFFVPGFAGPQFKRLAVEAAQALSRAVGHGSGKGLGLPLGIGIDVGTAFIGNVGGDEYVDFTALGDPVNTAARIRSAAGPGEVLVSDAAFAAVADRYPGSEPRLLDLKGKASAIAVHSIPVG